MKLIYKLFAAEFYYVREMYIDTVKHLYDITNLYKNSQIKEFLQSAVMASQIGFIMSGCYIVEIYETYIEITVGRRETPGAAS